MFLIRDACAADLDGLQAVASHLDSVNLPDDRDRLRTLIATSEKSFAGECPVADRRFLFVLTDTTSGQVLGSSMIFAQHGSRRSPHVYFDVIAEERYSQTLDRHFVHRVLRIGYNYNGVTEIGGLVLLPQFRGHSARLGMLLSAVRFVYMASHRSDFRDQVLSELMPPLDPDGTSKLWEALGRKFTGLSYQDADRLSHENKEFIRALFPEEPIYASLLPEDVQAVIGQVGPETKGVESMLRRIGFEYAHRIDPFDGGPHFHALVDEVTLVARTRQARIAEQVPSTADAPAPAQGQAADQAPDQAPNQAPDQAPNQAPDSDGLVLIAAETERSPARPPLFRAIATKAVYAGDWLVMSPADRLLLSVAVGARVAYLPLGPEAGDSRRRI